MYFKIINLQRSFFSIISMFHKKKKTIGETHYRKTTSFFVPFRKKYHYFFFSNYVGKNVIRSVFTSKEIAIPSNLNLEFVNSIEKRNFTRRFISIIIFFAKQLGVYANVKDILNIYYGYSFYGNKRNC